jgi:hypothetical protein
MVFPLEEVGYYKYHLQVSELGNKPLGKHKMGDYHSSFTEGLNFLRFDNVYLGE